MGHLLTPPTKAQTRRPSPSAAWQVSFRYSPRSVPTLTGSVSEGHSLFPRLRFGLVSLRAVMSQYDPGRVGYRACVPPFRIVPRRLSAQL